MIGAVQPSGTSTRWLRAGGERRMEPRWGHRDGLQVGLAPLPGPRGLLRVYAPYLGHASDRVINFIAVEPVPRGSTTRGYSELETSLLDGVPGLRFWSANDLEDALLPPATARPSAGMITGSDGIQTLCVHIGIEPFRNGARVALRLSFRSDRPYDVTIAAFAGEGSVPLDTCILSATMGNFARLRRLHLTDRVIHAGQLWPHHEGTGFTVHAQFPLECLPRQDGAVVVAATPDEAHPERATHTSGTRDHWRYTGRTAVQSWHAADPDPGLVAQVNGRSTYWASSATIPGGVAFENLELVEPFRQGREMTFAVRPLHG